MTHPCRPHDDTASRGRPCAGAAWIDSGIAAGLVVVDSNRPAANAGHANGLPKQSRIAP